MPWIVGLHTPRPDYFLESGWFLRTAATSAAPRPEPSVESIRSNWYSTPISWEMRDLGSTVGSTQINIANWLLERMAPAPLRGCIPAKQSWANNGTYTGTLLQSAAWLKLLKRCWALPTVLTCTQVADKTNKVAPLD